MPALSWTLMNESPPLFDNGVEKSSGETEGLCGMTKTNAANVALLTRCAVI